jgi:signal recognition particle subunit SEC65
VRWCRKGLAQGDPMSPLIFNIVTHKIAQLTENVMLSQYADDIVIYKRSRDLSESVACVQVSLDEITNMLRKLGLEISPSKTKACLFTRGRKLHNIKLSHGNNQILVVDKVKYLGFWLDKALLFNTHINEIAVKVSKYLNILKMLSGPTWGVHPSHLRRLYIALIRSRLDYACFLYDCSAKSFTSSCNKIR